MDDGSRKGNEISPHSHHHAGHDHHHDCQGHHHSGNDHHHHGQDHHHAGHGLPDQGRTGSIHGHCSPSHHMAQWQAQGARSRHYEHRLIWVIALSFVTMVAEIGGGYLSGSMALVADGWHMGSHVGALGISLLAFRFMRSPQLLSVAPFGLGKISSLAGFASALGLGVVALLTIGESVIRLWEPAPIRFDEALLIAAIGLVINIVSAFFLSPSHAGHDHNVRGAYAHVLADALTSVLALVALLGGKYLGLWWTDPIMGVVGGLIIARWSWQLARDSGRVLCDLTPPTFDEAKLRAYVRDAWGAEIRKLYVWEVSLGQLVCILHAEGAQSSLPNEARQDLCRVFQFAELVVDYRPLAG